MRILLPVVLTITILLSYCFILPLGTAQAAGNAALSAGVKTAPVLTADSKQNVIRKPAELTFADDAAWREAISEVRVDGVLLAEGEYRTETAGKIIIDQSLFKTSGRVHGRRCNSAHRPVLYHRRRGNQGSCLYPGPAGSHGAGKNGFFGDQ